MRCQTTADSATFWEHAERFLLRDPVINNVLITNVLARRASLMSDTAPATYAVVMDATGLEAAGADLVRERVVDHGDRVTAGGVTSGIDLGLWLTERFLGAELAERAAERLEYGWQRPTSVLGR